MDDIRNNKRSLREILPGDDTNTNNSSPMEVSQEEEMKTPDSKSEIKKDITPSFAVPETPTIRNRSPRRTNVPIKGIIITLVVAGVLVALFALSFVFAKATVHITPRQADVILTEADIFTAVAESDSDDILKFGTVVNDFTESRLVQATGEVNVSKEASGQVIVYNAYDENPLKLIDKTRFETADGKVYRIRGAVTVPPMKGGVPGSLEVTVYADQPGESYNVSLSDFTLPGLKDDPRFDKVYARSKTPMTGGFVGKTKEISESDKERVTEELKSALTQQIENSSTLDIPKDQILLPDSSKVTFGNLNISTASDPNQAQVSLTASRVGVLISKRDLAETIANAHVPEYNNEAVDIYNPEELTFVLQNGEDFDPSGASEVSFSVTGTARLVWLFDEEDLKNAVAGLSRGSYGSKLAEFPAIHKGSVSFFPPWMFNLPKDGAKIEVEQEIN